MVRKSRRRSYLLSPKHRCKYQNLILNPRIEQPHDDELQYGSFQQDGATTHIAQGRLDYLRQFFGDRLVSRDQGPPRSPYLTPLDYFMFTWN